MGISAYNRGSLSMQRQADAARRPVEFEIMERLNALPKTPDAAHPFGPIHFVFDHHGCWAECPRTGYGFRYQTLREAVQHWHVAITEYHEGRWIGIPMDTTP